MSYGTTVPLTILFIIIYLFIHLQLNLHILHFYFDKRHSKVGYGSKQTGIILTFNRHKIQSTINMIFFNILKPYLKIGILVNSDFLNM